MSQFNTIQEALENGSSTTGMNAFINELRS